VLKLTAANGGVVMVNFYPGFVVPAAAERGKKAIPFLRELKNKYGNDSDKIRAEMRNWAIQNPTDPGSIHVVLDHIDHIAKVAGVDHVGIGSDYDGIETVPRQLEDVSTYPRITQGLLDRGYSEADIHKILGGNLLRVMRAAEETARTMKSKGK
jgi:membrane dipeptidase